MISNTSTGIFTIAVVNGVVVVVSGFGVEVVAAIVVVGVGVVVVSILGASSDVVDLAVVDGPRSVDIISVIFSSFNVVVVVFCVMSDFDVVPGDDDFIVVVVIDDVAVAVVVLTTRAVVAVIKLSVEVVEFVVEVVDVVVVVFVVVAGVVVAGVVVLIFFRPAFLRFLMRALSPKRAKFFFFFFLDSLTYVKSSD